MEKLTHRQEQAAETRRKLLDAAGKLFAESGYTATPVRKINNAIGMADGLLYHYFPGGKKEILQTLVKETFVRIMATLRAHIANIDDMPLEDAIEALYQKWAKPFSEHQNVIKIMFKENGIMQIIEPNKLLDTVRDSDKWFPDFLRRRAQKGEVREMDYEIATEVLRAILFSHFLAILTGAGAGLLSNAEHRRKLIAHHVGLWKNPRS